MPKFNVQPLRVFVIVHGKSEWLLCKSIGSNLKIKQEVVARAKGRTSIQVSSLLDVLKSEYFKFPSKFIAQYPDVDRYKRKPKNFIIFPIMDLDDCNNDIERENYKTGKMFKGLWMADNIVPIYNQINLENTMRNCNITVVDKTEYIRIFPTNHGDLDLDKAESFCQKLCECACTNMEKYIEYCLKISEQRS